MSRSNAIYIPALTIMNKIEPLINKYTVMLYYTDTPEPTLTVLGETYKGISMLEALDLIIRNPHQYPTISQVIARKYFQSIAMYFQQPIVPTLGFKLCSPDAVVPTKRVIDVGFDLTIISIHSNISNKITMYDTGVALNIPIGYYVELVPRSSLSKTGYMLANSVGIIDPGYTGTVKVPLIRIDESMPEMKLHTRVAQLILKPYVFAHAHKVDHLHTSSRGTDGFGSTNS